MVGVNRCAARGCGRWTRADEKFCGRHAIDSDEDDNAAARQTAAGHAAFRARLAAGDYDAVLGPALRRVLRGAAADPGMEAEIGALRLALIRLLDEERDPSRLAAGVARLASVAVQAARLRQGGESTWKELQALLERELAEIEGEEREKGGRGE
jgi:hypothetical protein